MNGQIVVNYHNIIICYMYNDDTFQLLFSKCANFNISNVDQFFTILDLLKASRITLRFFNVCFRGSFNGINV